MQKSRLSIFIDESGDFGDYDFRKPYYYVAMVVHDQSVDISEQIRTFQSHMSFLGFEKHAVHAGPLIRRESVYCYTDRESRRKLFNAMCHFFRVVEAGHTVICIEKHKDEDCMQMQFRLTRSIVRELQAKMNFFGRFDEIIVYYDNGQIELTRSLAAVFSMLFSNVEFRKVRPKDYILFQCADLICTLELVARKFRENVPSKSEVEFFKSRVSFVKDICLF